jgi:hypothetical protein
MSRSAAVPHALRDSTRTSTERAPNNTESRPGLHWENPLVTG